jgi:hypothetical protein
MPGGAPLGSRNASKQKLWEDSIRRAVLADDGKRLRAIAEKLLDLAAEGDIAAMKEIGDRLDGKAVQGVSGPEGGPVEMVFRWASEKS